MTGGAAGNAAAADETDEEEAFARTAVNWKEKGKQRGGKTKTTRQNTFRSFGFCYDARTHQQVNSTARAKTVWWKQDVRLFSLCCVQTL